MKSIDYSNIVQKEAILNECKGNIFEFLVAQNLASLCQVESQFLLGISPELKKQLTFYEEIIRQNEVGLLSSLRLMAKDCAFCVYEDLSLANYQFKGWSVIGKLVASNENELWNETDVVGVALDSQKNELLFPLSLKLTKANSFTNTKSAGAKSFIQKYFSSFGNLAQSLQVEFNNFYLDSFQSMGEVLYGLIDQSFSGTFDNNWSNHFSELPGELPAEMKKVVHENYYKIASNLRCQMLNLYSRDHDLFLNSLAAICGFGDKSIFQINCFHQNYEKKDIKILTYDQLFKKKECHFLDSDSELSSFCIILDGWCIQIRIKPMNKFTSPSYKINCSIKEVM